jgi:hypothetical protein
MVHRFGPAKMALGPDPIHISYLPSFQSPTTIRYQLPFYNGIRQSGDPRWLRLPSPQPHAPITTYPRNWLRSAFSDSYLSGHPSRISRAYSCAASRSKPGSDPSWLCLLSPQPHVPITTYARNWLRSAFSDSYLSGYPSRISRALRRLKKQARQRTHLASLPSPQPHAPITTYARNWLRSAFSYLYISGYPSRISRASSFAASI